MNEVQETVVPGLVGTDFQASYGDGPYDFVWFKYDKMNVRNAGASPKAPPKPKGGKTATTTTTTVAGMAKNLFLY